jgi:hypothetical protein
MIGHEKSLPAFATQAPLRLSRGAIIDFGQFAKRARPEGGRAMINAGRSRYRNRIYSGSFSV